MKACVVALALVALIGGIAAKAVQYAEKQNEEKLDEKATLVRELKDLLKAKSEGRDVFSTDIIVPVVTDTDSLCFWKDSNSGSSSSSDMWNTSPYMPPYGSYNSPGMSSPYMPPYGSYNSPGMSSPYMPPYGSSTLDMYGPFNLPGMSSTLDMYGIFNSPGMSSTLDMYGPYNSPGMSSTLDMYGPYYNPGSSSPSGTYYEPWNDPNYNYYGSEYTGPFDDSYYYVSNDQDAMYYADTCGFNKWFNGETNMCQWEEGCGYNIWHFDIDKKRVTGVRRESRINRLRSLEEKNRPKTEASLNADKVEKGGQAPGNQRRAMAQRRKMAMMKMMAQKRKLAQMRKLAERRNL